MISAGRGEQRRYYLKTAHVGAFGNMFQRDLGPFTAGMNVVFGGNETGKTTAASFIGGVLFGWEEARGQRNAYLPEGLQRSGTLVFANRGDEGETVRVSRVRNADGVRVSDDSAVLADIDKDTFKTVFSLNSDELRRLDKTNDVTARLLTAGSGTAVPPTAALAECDRRLAQCLSRSAHYPDSIANCRAERDQVQIRLNEARREMEQFCHEDLEFKELEPLMHELEEGLASCNEDVEALSAARESVAKLDADMVRLREQETDLDAEEVDLDALEQSYWDGRDDRLPHLDIMEERAVREGIEDLAEERSRLDSVVSLAKHEYAASKAAYEALQETENEEHLAERSARRRIVQLGLTVVTPALFALIGVPLFVHGRMVHSLSFSAVGVMLAVFAVCIVLVAVVSMVLRPGNEGDESRKRLKDAQWVMLQDRKKMEAMIAERQAHGDDVERYLQSYGLGPVSGNLRHARAMLDAISQARSDWQVLDQRRRSLTAQRVSLDDQMRRNASERVRVLESVGVKDDATIEALDRRLQARQQQRKDQLQTSASYHARYGELKQKLSTARRMRRFDELKLQDQMLHTRLDDATWEYARLLLAKRMLTSAIASWEQKSQPRVYQQASRLLAAMTDGRWVQVRLDAEGNLKAIDEFGMDRMPVLLSMGTCQQLYLAMRIALLITAENVGANVPVLADDILVNFDETRRRGAAKALAELAQYRQVIFFTCHEEVVRLMQVSCPNVNLIRL